MESSDEGRKIIASDGADDYACFDQVRKNKCYRAVGFS